MLAIRAVEIAVEIAVAVIKMVVFKVTTAVGI
jgi:hypothetical protein